MQFAVSPTFNSLRNSITFPVDEINALQVEEYNDKFGFYQSTFGVYSYMTLNQKLKFKIHYPTGTPFVWQTNRSCAWTPTGTLDMTSKEIEPFLVKINEENCYDEFIASAYSSFLDHGQTTTELSSVGVQAVDALARTIVKSATLGARMSMTGGMLHDLTSIDFATGVPERIQSAFAKTNSAVKGWIQLVRELAALTGNEHMETGTLGDNVTNEISTNGKEFEGSVVATLDAVYAAAPGELQDAIAEGGIGGYGDNFYPLALVSNSMIRAVRREFNEQKSTAMVNEPRITVERFPFETPQGTRDVKVYMIDDVVLVPISEVGQYDKYLDGTSHFMYLTLSGVVQMGASFDSLPVVNESEIGIRIQVSDDNKDYGNQTFLAHALMASAINDTKMIAGDYLFATPA